MKKKIIIGLSVFAIVAIGAVIYLYLTFFNGTDFSKNVPKNAFLVMKVDLMGMGKKINLKEATESKAFRKEIMESMKSSQKEMIEKVIENPLKSGLQLASKPTLFVFNNSKTEEEPVMGFMFGISDKNNFNDFLEQINKNITIKEPDFDGFSSANLDNENVVLYFNDKVGLILVDLERKSLPLKRIRDEIVSLEKDKSILLNEEFTTLNNQPNDMMVYFNGPELSKVFEINKNAQIDQIRNSIKAYPYAMTLNFNEDAVAIKVLSNKSKEASTTAILKETGISESELRNIDPKGSPLAYLTMNMDVKKVLELINDQSALYQGYLNIFNQIDNTAADLKVPKEDLMNLFDGKMSLSFSGIQPPNKSDSLDMYQSPTFLVNGWAHLGNKDAATKLLDYYTTIGLLENNEGIYSDKTEFSAPEIFMTVKDNDLFFSTLKEPIQNKIQGKDWEGLKETLGKKDALAKSATFFADLRYSSYETMIKSVLSSRESVSIDKFKNILSSFKSISMTGNNNEAEFIIQFSEKKTNSLQRIMDLLTEAYRLVS
jgi:hypothetical protein